MIEGKAQSRLSRRTVAKGAAWAMPAVAAVTVAPMAAASPKCEPNLELSPDSCKCPGNGANNWDYFVKVCNDGGVTCPDADGTLHVVIRANTGANVIYYPPSGAIAIPVGGCSDVITFNATNSSSKLRVAYGATPEEARAEDAPYEEVDAPPNCEAGDLGTCG